MFHYCDLEEPLSNTYNFINNGEITDRVGISVPFQTTLFESFLLDDEHCEINSNIQNFSNFGNQNIYQPPNDDDNNLEIPLMQSQNNINIHNNENIEINDSKEEKDNYNNNNSDCNDDVDANLILNSCPNIVIEISEKKEKKQKKQKYKKSNSSFIGRKKKGDTRKAKHTRESKDNSYRRMIIKRMKIVHIFLQTQILLSLRSKYIKIKKKLAKPSLTKSINKSKDFQRKLFNEPLINLYTKYSSRRKNGIIDNERRIKDLLAFEKKNNERRLEILFRTPFIKFLEIFEIDNNTNSTNNIIEIENEKFDITEFITL